MDLILLIMIIAGVWYFIDQLNNAIKDWKNNTQYIGGSCLMTPTGQVFIMLIVLLVYITSLLKE